MRASKPLLMLVNGFVFEVRERAGIFKADMHGVFGWMSVWADSRENLNLRVKAALRGGQ